MTAPKLPNLDSDLATLPVDPEQRWFHLPVEVQVALVGFSKTVADLRKPGRSRDRKKAGVDLVLLIAATGDISEPVLDALISALDLKPRDLGKRRGVPVTWLYQQPAVEIEENRPTGELVFVPAGQPAPHVRVRVRLGDEEATALRIIADVAAHGPCRANKVAVLDVLRWHAQQGRMITPLVVNALAAVARVLDPSTGAVDLTGNDPGKLAAEAQHSARHRLAQIDADLARVAQKVGWLKLTRLAGVKSAEPESDSEWIALAQRASKTALDLYAQAGVKAKPPKRPPPLYPRQTSSDLRKDPRFEALENGELKRLGEHDRRRDVHDDVWAAQAGAGRTPMPAGEIARLAEELTVRADRFTLPATPSEKQQYAAHLGKAAETARRGSEAQARLRKRTGYVPEDKLPRPERRWPPDRWLGDDAFVALRGKDTKDDGDPEVEARRAKLRSEANDVASGKSRKGSST
ncbi:MAG: hypothetical protein ABIY37_03760 [Devosia sp.]